MNEVEKDTVSKMIGIYCRYKHGSKSELCSECSELREYACKRLEKCIYEEDKPNCNDCPVHCYKKDMKERICEVMRFSGPRMIFYYPKDAIKHLINKKRTNKYLS